LVAQIVDEAPDAANSTFAWVMSTVLPVVSLKARRYFWPLLNVVDAWPHCGRPAASNGYTKLRWSAVIR
jgi:hypothetical protein